MTTNKMTSGSRFDGAWDSLKPAEQSLFDLVVSSCGPDTCAPALQKDLIEFEGERRTYGSCIVAATTFLNLLSDEESEEWVPIVLGDESFEESHPLYCHISLYNRKTGKVMDFTAASRFGGIASFSVNEQMLLLQTKFLQDQTLLGRIGNSLKNAGLAINSQQALEKFLKRFEAGLKQDLGQEIIASFKMAMN